MERADGGRYLHLFWQASLDGRSWNPLRHQFASEALDANPRELANISQVLGHDSIQSTLT